MNQTGKKPVRPAPAGEPTTTKREVTARVRNPFWTGAALLLAGAVAVSTGCAGDRSAPNVSQHQLENRAYIVSQLSDDLTVIDLDRLEIVGTVHTLGIGNHMAELNADLLARGKELDHSRQFVQEPS